MNSVLNRKMAAEAEVAGIENRRRHACIDTKPATPRKRLRSVVYGPDAFKLRHRSGSFKRGVFRRSHVQNNPVNLRDPSGEIAWGPVAGAGLALYTIKSGIDTAADIYYDYKKYQSYERYIEYLRTQLKKTSSCEVEKYNLLDSELKKMVLEQSTLATKQALQRYVDFMKSVINTAR